jgi:hypothetical protein
MRRGEHSDLLGSNIRLIEASVPVVVAFTKSDLAFPHISGSESGHHQYQDQTMTRAYAQCEQLCRSLFRREAKDVPAQLVSGDYYYSFRDVCWISHFVFSEPKIQWSCQQSNCDVRPVHDRLGYCPFVTVELKGSEATSKDIPRFSCMVRCFESVSRHYHSSFHRVCSLSLDTHLVKSVFSGLDGAVGISTLRTSQF